LIGTLIIASLSLLIVFVAINIDLIDHNSVLTDDEDSHTVVLESMMSNQPLRFVANQGQAGTEAKFHIEGAGHTVLFCENKVLLRRSESVLLFLCMV